MRFGQSRELARELWRERNRDRETPHRWFAWYPVTTDSGVVVWLEGVIRRQSYFWTEDGALPVWRYKENNSDVL